MILDSTHITTGSPHTSYHPKIHIETYKFEKKAENMYCNVCALEISLDDLIEPFQQVKGPFSAHVRMGNYILMSRLKK